MAGLIAVEERALPPHDSTLTQATLVVKFASAATETRRCGAARVHWVLTRYKFGCSTTIMAVSRKADASVHSKQKKAYYRKLYLAHLIDTGRHDQVSLEAATAWPRRTLQDAIKAMADIGLVCEFCQQGSKNRHGFYTIKDWGDHSPDWIVAHLAEIRAMLGLDNGTLAL
jgi:hypothetical protein